jgi:hypothetical protein
MVMQPSRRTPRIARFGTWALFAALSVGAFAPALASGPATLAPAPAQVTVAAGETVVLAKPATSGSLDRVIADNYNVAVDTNGDGVLSQSELEAARDNGKLSVTKLLPSFRWTNTAPDDQSGFFDGGVKVTTSVAAIFVSMAGFLWSITLKLMEVAATLDLTSLVGTMVDRGFSSFASAVFASGLLVVVLLVVLLAMLKELSRGNTVQVLRTIGTALIPIALLSTLAANAGNSTDNFTATGSPAWFAQEGVKIVDQVGSGIGSGFGVLPGTAALLSPKSANLEPSCTTYMNGLYNQFYVAKGLTPPDLSTDAGASGFYTGSGGGQLALLSRLWQSGFYEPWTRVQFGSPAGDIDYGTKMGCHQLEWRNNYSADEQRAVMGVGLTASGVSAAKQSSSELYRPRGKENEASGYIFFWGACNLNDGAWSADPSFAAISSIDGDWCSNAWATGDLRGELQWKNEDSVRDKASANQAGEDAAEAVVNYKGHNGGERMAQGLILLLTAGVYLWALGALAVGAIFAQLGLVLLLFLLPGTLMLIALPGQKGKAIGTKFLKMTGGFLASKLVITVVLALLLQTILVVTAVLSSIAPMLAWLAPLLAVFLLHFLLKAAGLGQLLKPSGALGLTAGGVMKATGNSDMATKMRKSFNDATNANPAAKKAMDMARRFDRTPQSFGAQAVAGTVGGTARAIGRQRERARLAGELGELSGPDAGNNVRKFGDTFAETFGDGVGGTMNTTDVGELANLGAINAAPLPDGQAVAGSLAGYAALGTDPDDARQAAAARLGYINSLPAMERDAEMQRWLTEDAAGLANAQMTLGIVDHSQVEVGTLEYQATTKAAVANKTGLAPERVWVDAAGSGAIIIPTGAVTGTSGSLQHLAPLNIDDARQGARRAINFLDKVQLDQVASDPALSESQKVQLLNALELHEGLRGVDYTAMHGINLDTDTGSAALQEALAGYASPLDQVATWNVPSDVYNRLRRTVITTPDPTAISSFERGVGAAEALAAQVAQTRERHAESRVFVAKLERAIGERVKQDTLSSSDVAMVVRAAEQTLEVQRDARLQAITAAHAKTVANGTDRGKADAEREREMQQFLGEVALAERQLAEVQKTGNDRSKRAAAVAAALQLRESFDKSLSSNVEQAYRDSQGVLRHSHDRLAEQRNKANPPDKIPAFR